MEQLLRDIRYGVRVLVACPGFTVIAVLALALGIGANTAIFSVINTVLLQPLPFPEPERLVEIWGSSPSRGIPFHQVFYPDVCEWKKQSQSFEQMYAMAYQGTNLVLGNEPERLVLWRVNSGLLPMLGARFQLGRGFLEEEDRPGAGRVAILTDQLWRRRLGAERGVIGKTLLLDGNDYTVVGVLAPEFGLPDRTMDIVAPLCLGETRDLSNRGFTVEALGRLKPGIALARAQAEMDTIGPRLEQSGQTLGAHPRLWLLHDFMVRNLKPSLIVLLAAVGLVLLIACANVANLLLVRAGMRRRELGVRTALGATRFRVIRQLLTESCLLGFAGGAAGVLLAYWGVQALLLVVPENYGLLSRVSIDTRVLLFTLLISLATGIVFGLAPALAASRRKGLGDVLKEAGRGSGETISKARLRSTLVVAEVALALLLLIGAGLMIRSFLGLTSTHPGFSPRGVVTAGITLPETRYARFDQRITFFKNLFRELDSLPGVVAAGAVSSLPLTGHNTGTGLVIEGRPLPRPDEVPLMWFRIVSSGYFRAMEIPLVSGRLFKDEDQTGPPVVVINQAMARRYWPKENPVGKRLTTGLPVPGRPTTWMTVVGVVGDIRHTSLSQEPEPEAFWPYQQHSPGQLSLVVRVNSDPANFAPLLRKATAAVDKDQPVAQARTMEQILGNSIATQRLSVVLLSVFAGLALALAAVGIYGVISFSVARRTQEIGIRMALGARQADVIRMIVSQALTLATIGVVAGLVGAVALTRFLTSLLFHVSATDPLILGGVSALLVGVAIVASYLPARRAATTHPIEALRYE